MPTKPKKLITLVVVFVFCGCVGRDFVRPDVGSLENGVTTYSQVIQQFGKPYAEGETIKNGKPLKTAAYVYVSAGGKSHSGATAGRSMGFYFLDNTLVGYEFLSSFAEDNTDFDEMKISDIKEGKTTMDEVVKLLGKPSGYYIYPVIDSPSDEAAVYLYSENKGSAFNLRYSEKVLIITYNDDRVVTKVDYSSIGTN